MDNPFKTFQPNLSNHPSVVMKYQKPVVPALLLTGGAFPRFVSFPRQVRGETVQYRDRFRRSCSRVARRRFNSNQAGLAAGPKPLRRSNR